MKEEKYFIQSHTFLGRSESGYKYEITFNKSLEHTGKFLAIEKALDEYDRKERRQNMVNAFNIWFKGLLR